MGSYVEIDCKALLLKLYLLACWETHSKIRLGNNYANAKIKAV